VALGRLLVQAAHEGDAAAVARLLAAGADPNASVPGRNASGEAVQATALEAAVGPGRLEVARLLLEGGADPSRLDSEGNTPLMTAAGEGHLEVLRLLLERGAAVDAVHPAGDTTAFHNACYSNHPQCAEALARAGCDVGLKTNSGWTGREIAETEGHTAVMARLRAVVAEQLRAAQAAARASPESEPVAFAGERGLGHDLAYAAIEGDWAALLRLLAAGADPNTSVPAENASGETVQATALVAAAMDGRLEVARRLLEGGADPDLTGGDGTTPLMLAAGHGWLEVLRVLLGRGAAVDAVEPTTGGTAFHIACENNQAECAEALAHAGCDIGAKDIDGMTGRE
jgi:ankyrin repeat protein